jgi:nicotinamide-nucleotide amidase
MEATLSTAAILATGDEIVGGRTVDTNSSWLADRLAANGVEVTTFLAVSDDIEDIRWAWRAAAERVDLVISTGGLGPTTDDLTTEAVAGRAGATLRLDERQAERIREVFRRRGRPMPENNLRQAMIPDGAEVIDNDNGTAPGFRLRLPRTGGGHSWGVVLPGVPREMKPMFEGTVLPWLATRVDPARVFAVRTFQTFGLSESALDERLRGVVPLDRARLAFRASFPKISVRVSVAGERERAEAEVETFAAAVRERIADIVYAEGEATMEQEVGRLLKEKHLMLATAESCSGGLIASRLTDVPGSSAYYSGGLVAYSNDLKQRLLGVPVETLKEHGAVSEPVARAMALGALAAADADIAVATTGIAGPDGGTEDKPVGTVAIAIARRGDAGRGVLARRVAGAADATVDSRLYRLWGGRDWVKTLTSQVALDWVRRDLQGLSVLEPSQLAARAGRTAGNN